MFFVYLLIFSGTYFSSFLFVDKKKTAGTSTNNGNSSGGGGSSSRNLWVSGLATNTRATDLKHVFSKYGKVRDRIPGFTRISSRALDYFSLRVFLTD